MAWVRLEANQQRVRQALLAGYVDEVVVCRTNYFDQLAAAMEELGYWDHLNLIQIELDKDGDDVPNELVRRELAVLPLLRIANPHQAEVYLFQDAGVLRFLGFTLHQLRDGFNEKGRRSPQGRARMRPHHRDDLYNALRAVQVASLEDFRRAHIQALFEHQVVTGGVYAIDGTGIAGTAYKLVVMQSLTAGRRFVVNWRVQGPGTELPSGRDLVAEVLALPGAVVRELLMDGQYVDGAWLAQLQGQGVDSWVRVHEDSAIYQEMLELSRLPEHAFETYTYVRSIHGRKETHTVELALFWGLQEWDSYRQAWATATGRPAAEWPGLWGLLVREQRVEHDQPKTIIWGVVCTRQLPTRQAAFNGWRLRWGVENQGFREWNQGAWLETELWGRSEAAIKTSIYLKLGAHNCYCLLNTRLGAHLVTRGLRGFQRVLYGAPPWIMVVVGPHYGLFTAEELVTLLGVHVKETLGARIAREPPDPRTALAATTPA